jgi:two-component system LytT family response regulator
MRAILIDDEARARVALRELLSKQANTIEVCGEAESVESAVMLVNTLKPDLLFLDIQLHRDTGFSVLKQIDTTKLAVIFTTAYSQYALKAIKYAALDYLLKPIDPDELKQAVDKALKQSVQHSLVSRITVLEELLLDQKKVAKKIVLSDHAGFNAVLLKDIAHCEGERNYTTFFLIDGREITTSQPLITYERLFKDNTFVRIYRSHLVNIEHVAQYIRGRGGWVVMSNGRKLPVSREKKEELIAALTTG